LIGFIQKKARAMSRAGAIPGVPLEVDVNRLKKAVYGSSDPKITPVFEELLVPERSGRLPVMQYLLRHPELDTASASRICQRSEAEAREILNKMEVEMEYLERGGTGRGTYWMLRPDLYRRLVADGSPERDRRIDWETAKTRVLSVLKLRAERKRSWIIECRDQEDNSSG
jgi:hypothetical protein